MLNSKISKIHTQYSFPLMSVNASINMNDNQICIDTIIRNYQSFPELRF
jgi:hypothetical protein